MQRENIGARRAHPMVQSLRAADCTLAMARRIGGPRKIKSALRDSGGSGIEIDEREIEIALATAEAVKAISDPQARKVIAAVMDTRSCTRVASISEIARAAGLTLITTRRALAAGIAELADIIADVERRAA